uniref:Uncharacterized protein n=1 Tax=Echinococcus canadensis TaxID=519352 RepID=A0A915EXA6_9CEST
MPHHALMDGSEDYETFTPRQRIVPSPELVLLHHTDISSPSQSLPPTSTKRHQTSIVDPDNI